MTRNEMKDLVEQLHRVWSTGELSAIPEIYAPDFIGHFPAASPARLSSARDSRMKMPRGSVSQASAGRAQPTLVFRQIVAPVQPGHALGAALIESGAERTLAGHVTTPLTGKRSRPRRSGARKIPSRVARSGRRPHAERRGSEIRPRVSGRISFPPSLSSSSQASAGRVAPALT